MLLDNTKNGFILKSNFELKKAYFLFKVISSRTLTNFGKNILELSLKLNLPVLFIVRATVFRQFCSGENLQESFKIVKKLNAKNVKVDKKLKMIELQLKKLKLDQNQGDDDAVTGTGTVIADRNELIKQILATKDKDK